MTSVFISYRRSDSAANAGRIADALRAHGSRPTVFFDTEGIAPGDHWRARIDDAVAKCDVMLVVIGPRWLDARLLEADDVVAHEVAAGLKRDIRIVPLLVAGATVPDRTRLPPSLAGLLDSNALEVRDGAFDRDLQALERAILPAAPGRGLLWAGLAAAAILLALGLGWFFGDKPAIVINGGKPPAKDSVVDLDVAFTRHAAMDEKYGATVRDLQLAIDKPQRTGPLLLQANGTRYLNAGLHLPPPGGTLEGTLLRIVEGSWQVTGDTADLIYTNVCFDVTHGTAPADGRLRLSCQEGKTCVPDGGPGIVVPCGGAPQARARPWDGLIASALAQSPPPSAAAPLRPAAGDWLVPRLDVLRAARGTPHAVAFSEVTLTLPDLPQAASADEVAYELTVNGRRLWVDGMAAWTGAVPHVAGQPLRLAFGLENLDASGVQHGHEALLVRILLLAHKQTIAQDEIALDFVALRTLDERAATTASGVPLRWAAQYVPAPGDRYQVFAYSGAESDTLAAKAKFDKAGAAGSAPAGTRALVGVVRPPNRNNKAWGVAIGEAQPSGQLRFSFDAATALALCASMNRPELARRLLDQGFGAPASFRVREIAVEANDDRQKPTVECRKFSGT